MTEHDRSDDKSSGAYALGALDAAETAEFEKNLAENEELRAEVAGFTDTAALLGGAIAPIAPPAHLRASLLAALDSTPQLPAETVSDLDQPEARPSVDEMGEAPREEARVTDLSAHRASRGSGSRRPRARLSYFVVAAAAAAAVFVGGTVVGSGIGSNEPAPQAAAVQELATLSTAPDMSRTVIELPDGGTAALMTSEEQGISAVVLDDPAALPDGSVYQAWLIRDGQPTSAGVVPADGSTVQLLEGTFHEGDSVALTVEPAGGSETPTGDPIFFSA